MRVGIFFLYRLRYFDSDALTVISASASGGSFSRDRIPTRPSASASFNSSTACTSPALRFSLSVDTAATPRNVPGLGLLQKDRLCLESEKKVPEGVETTKQNRKALSEVAVVWSIFRAMEIHTGYFQATGDGFQVKKHFGGQPVETPKQSVWKEEPSKSPELLVLRLTAYGPLGGLEPGIVVQVPRAESTKAFRVF